MPLSYFIISDFSSTGVYGFITGHLGIANACECSVEMGGRALTPRKAWLCVPCISFPFSALYFSISLFLSTRWVQI